MSNYWDNLMGSDEAAANYMLTYGEGVGCETRRTIAGLVQEGESLLDVGCGPGWNLDEFQTNGPKLSRYKGLDYSERMIRVANARWVRSSITWKLPHESRVQIYPFFEKGDCRKLYEPDTSWDVVLLQDVLEHTNGYTGPVHEALRVARKRVIVTFWHLDGNEGREHINNDGNDGYGAWYDRAIWEGFLNSLGYPWHEQDSSPEANRRHWFYVIDKEKHNG